MEKVTSCWKRTTINNCRYALKYGRALREILGSDESLSSDANILSVRKAARVLKSCFRELESNEGSSIVYATWTDIFLDILYENDDARRLWLLENVMPWWLKDPGETSEIGILNALLECFFNYCDSLRVLVPLELS